MEALAITATLVQLVEGALLVTKGTRNTWISYKQSQRELRILAKQNSVLEKLLAEATSVHEKLRADNGLGKQTGTRNVDFNGSLKALIQWSVRLSDTTDMYVNRATATSYSKLCGIHCSGYLHRIRRSQIRPHTSRGSVKSPKSSKVRGGTPAIDQKGSK